jgi:hydrogenase nickel incorporation protein HypA/HybF
MAVHELSLIHSLLDIVEDYATRHRFKRVRSLNLSFGRLSCLDPQALKFAFDIESAGTKAEGAALIFDVRPARLTCLACNREVEVEQWTATCPLCQGAEVLLTGGTEELKLVEMDVD